MFPAFAAASSGGRLLRSGELTIFSICASRLGVENMRFSKRDSALSKGDAGLVCSATGANRGSDEDDETSSKTALCVFPADREVHHSCPAKARRVTNPTPSRLRSEKAKTTAPETGGLRHSSPDSSKTGRRVNWNMGTMGFKTLLRNSGERRGKKIGFPSWVNATSPETWNKSRFTSRTGGSTMSSERAACWRNDS